MALAEVGEPELTALSEANTTGQLCRRFIGAAVSEILNMGKWKCARAGVELPQITLAPKDKPLGWDYAYQLPEDYIRIVSFNETDADEQWQKLYEVRGDRLLTQCPQAYIVYVRDLSVSGEDVHLMPPLLVRACALNLAARLAWVMHQNRTLRESLEQGCEAAVRKAKASGALEEFRPVLNPANGSRWLSVLGP